MTDRTHEVLRACDATVNRSAGYSAALLLTVKSSIGVLEQSRAGRAGRVEFNRAKCRDAAARDGRRSHYSLYRGVLAICV